jgi:chloramphenicol 3-O phosphotransferase
VLLWERHVHDPGLYDLEIDTSVTTPEESADRIGALLAAGLARPTAVERLLN